MGFCNIIFDLDGTLIDSARVTGHIIDTMLAERGVTTPADLDLIKKMDAVGGAAMIAAVMGPHTSDPVADLDEFRRRHKMVDVSHDVLFPGVTAAIGQLSSMGVGMAICSNKPQPLCDKILGDLGIATHFAIIVGNTPNRPRKPDPASALLALDALGGGKETALFCGDSVIDVKTATSAGVAVCLVGWGYGTAHARGLHPSLPVLDEMADLIALVHLGRT